MSMKGEFLLYLGTFALFAAVLLWADDAGLALVVVAAALFAAILVFAAWQIRRSRKVLVVGDASPQTRALEDAVERAGYEVCWCAGPSNRPCPVFRGEPCPLHERPAAAIVFRAAGEHGRYAPCGEALRVPEVLVEEYLEAPPERVGSVVREGFDRGPDRVVRDMEQLLT